MKKTYTQPIIKIYSVTTSRIMSTSYPNQLGYGNASGTSASGMTSGNDAKEEGDFGW